MSKKSSITRIDDFRNQCIFHLKNESSHNKRLYWDIMPTHLVGKEHSAKIIVNSIVWNNNFNFSCEKSERQLRQIIYTESCKADLTVIIDTGIIFKLHNDLELNFRVVREHPSFGGKWVFMETQYSQKILDFHTILINTQNHFELVAIDSYRFDEQDAFSFFSSTLRRDRLTQPTDRRILDMNYYQQISMAHGEIAVCISNLLIYWPLIGELTENRIISNGETYYMPNVNYNDFQFYMWCTFCIERLYSYWETLLVILYNYDSLKIGPKKVSFGNYFYNLDKKISDGASSVFPKTSTNLKWLLDYANKDYKEITKLRHRSIHHEFTDDNDGLLTAKYYINAFDNVSDKKSLDKYSFEIKKYPSLLMKHFKLCLEGFEKTLLLIDELD
jgi:hypothetical protein